jgi:predicted metal-dependent peptidase
MIITVPDKRGTPKKIECLDALAKVRREAVKRAPFIARGVWAMQFIETDKVPTMAVDKRLRVYVNPKHVEECLNEGNREGMSDAAVVGIIHEWMHPGLRHGPRAEAIHAHDHERWNRCGDREIARNIEAMGLTLWSKDVSAERDGVPPGLSAEEYYKLQNPKGGKGGGEGAPQLGPGNPGKGPPQPGKPDDSECQCCSGGSGATGQPAPWELADDDPKAPGLSEAEVDIVRAAVAADIREHEAKRPGSVPAGLLRWAETFGEAPPVPWADMIGARVRYQVEARRGVMPSYARPSRRDAPGGIILPVHRAPRANVALVLDTSGSMSDSEDIPKALAVTFDACQVLGKVTVVPCDAEAYEAVEVRHVDDLRDFLKGGGGTNMPAGIRNAEGLNPDAIVVVTDGETSWPDEAPEVPVTIVLTREPKYSAAPPCWAEVIQAH